MVYYIIGIIFAVLSGIFLVVALLFDNALGQTNDLLVAVLFMLPACVFFIIGTLNSKKFINNYHKPSNNENLARKPAPPSAANNVRILKSNPVRSIKYSDYTDNTDNAESSDNSVAVTDNKPQETDSYEYLVWVTLIIVVACFFVGIFFSRLYR